MLSAEPKTKADNTYRDLDYLGYHENRQTHHRKEPELILLLKIMHCEHNLEIIQLSAGK